jgi:hypothetical protein
MTGSPRRSAAEAGCAEKSVRIPRRTRLSGVARRDDHRPHWKKEPRKQMKNKPLLIVAALAFVALCGAWYFWPKSQDDGLVVMVDGKQVDPSTIKEIKGPDGKPLDLRRDMQDPFKRMGETVDAYFALPAGPQRNAYLDKLIDQQEAAQKDIKDLKLGDAPAGDGRIRMTMAAPPTTQPGDDKGGEGGAPKSIMVRRTGGAGGDSMPPDLRAKVAELVSAMNKRRAERGLPPGPGGIMIVNRTDGK